MEHEIISRKKAKEQGLKFYFTGKPCPNGNVAERFVSSKNCACQECRQSGLKFIRRFRKENREQYLNEKRERYQRHHEQNLESQRKYRQRNKSKRSEAFRQWVKENPGKWSEHLAKRRAAKRNAIPKWFSEWDEFVIQQACELAAMRDAETGIKWHVDHMIPLKSKNACGLHCAANIQVIPAKMNNEKYNKLILTEPLQWLK